ncbi:Predicted integral membrane protein [Oceanospirillum multiglobuliferum]|uniref:Signal peptidase n=1 Tax=Oceanospirillum multiglobuliferum TaxID=64969 RepID=A0A1T4PR54_9GAMM|nr:DUF2282 domain-containing protein [Oceanospirillum multiglobuliferum]OPX55357.1 hypothetical protein BTE48_09330 [Oceanospirillum multiglobuliferum]SJZ94062.1 Predicted integral membrane protein [Oceanospirillum multiglobuliferum]
MSQSKLAMAAVMSGVIALGAATATPVMAAEKEKCYGVAKAGQNDCATKNSSCAGTSKKDFQGDAFLAVPKGMCGKLAGGSLTAKN